MVLNEPEYFVTDVMREIVEATRIALGLPVLNYQYGYLEELNQTVINWGKTDEWMNQKYPLIWFRQPVTIIRDEPGYYGRIDDGTLFIMTSTNKEWKAERRTLEVFKPILYPIYREVLKQFQVHPAIITEYFRNHSLTERYYWGVEQKKEIGDSVDCLEVGNLNLKIHNNQDCIPFKNF